MSGSVCTAARGMEGEGVFGGVKGDCAQSVFIVQHGVWETAQ